MNDDRQARDGGSIEGAMSAPLLRRDPCLCGSGRLFASCCADRHASDLSAWRRIRRIDEDVVPRIIEYLREIGGPPVWQHALHSFFVGCTSPESVRCAMPSFIRWCPLTWVPDGRDEVEDAGPTIPEGWPSAPLGVTWLASTSQGVASDEQTFILKAARSPFSFLLVESIVPGWSLAVRDLLTGRKFRVIEPQISARVLCEDILFSAVLTLDGVSTLLGCGSLCIPSDWRVQIGQTREVHANGAWLTQTDLFELAPNLCLEYREACDDDRVVELDANGHPRDLLLLRWTVTLSVAEMFERLRSLSVWRDEDEAISDETGPDGVPRLCLSWYEQPPAPDADDRHALGYLYLDEGRLAAHVASRPLSERLMQEIGMRLGSAVTHLETRPTMPTSCGVDESWMLYLLG
jgi:SEC-C motif